jgi:hypothetical protein
MGWKGRRLAERSSHRLERAGLRALLKHYKEREPFCKAETCLGKSVWTVFRTALAFFCRFERLFLTASLPFDSVEHIEVL